MPGEALADDLAHNAVKAVTVIKWISFGGPVVESEGLLVEVTEKMEWLNANVGSLDASLQERPVVFHSIGVNLPMHVSNGMVNDLVRVVPVKVIVGRQRISEESGPDSDMLSHLGLQGLLASIRNDGSADLTATLQNPYYGSLVLATSPGDSLCAFVQVHIAGESADESFVHFDFAADFPKRFILQSKPDAMQHEPCGLLSDAKGASHFVGTDSILAVGQHPSSSEPFVEADRLVFKDGAHLDGELPLGVVTATLPDTARRTERDFLRAASWADNTFRPAPRNKVVEAIFRIREVYNCFLQAFRFAHVLDSVSKD